MATKQFQRSLKMNMELPVCPTESLFTNRMKQLQSDSSALKQEIIRGIQTIYDPELPVNIYDLGLIYDIIINDKNEVTIVMTLTTPNCPSAVELPTKVEQVAKETLGVTKVVIDLTFDPPWDKTYMSEEALFEMGLL